MLSARSMLRGSTLIAVGSAAGLALAASSQAAVLENPTLSQGLTAIDPVSPNDEEIDAEGREGNVTEAQLEANPNFFVNQDFTGFESIRTGGTNVISFTGAQDSQFYDVQFDVNYFGERGGSGDVRDDLGAEHARSSDATSGASSVLLGRYAPGGSGPTGYNMVLDFGSYDSSTGTFTELSSGEGVGAASLTVGDIRTYNKFTVAFEDAAGNVLSTQSFGTAFSHEDDDDNAEDTTPGEEALFAYDADSGAPIASITLSQLARNNRRSGLDDLGFTAIPEPASLALVGVGGLALLGRRRRRA